MSGVLSFWAVSLLVAALALPLSARLFRRLLLFRQFLRDDLSHLINPLLLHIAKSHEIRTRSQRLHNDAMPATAAADQRDPGTIIGARRLGLGGVGLFELEEPGRDIGGGCDGGRILEETAAMDLKGLGVHAGDCTL